MQDEQSQELETTDSQAEAAEGQVNDSANIVEQVGQLLGTQETQEEIQETQEPPKEEAQEVKEETQPQVPIIDDTMITEYPALKMYRGKPITDLSKAYQNIVKAYTENQMKLKQIEKEQAKQKLPEPSQIPDPVEKPEEFKKWLADYTTQIRAESAPPPPQTDWVAEAKAVLPKEADFEKVRDNFMNFNAERFFNEMGELRPEVAGFYEKNPRVLINEMKSYYQLASQAEKNSMTIQTEAKNTAYNTIKTSLKKANENKEDLNQAQFNAVSRSSESTPEDEMLANIYKIAQGQ